MALKENYVDDILDTSVNTKRKYNMLSNADGTVSLEDVTEYSQNGDDFGANDVNAITKVLNETQEQVFENFIRFPYYETNHTEKDVQWTVDENGIITANGLASGRSQFHITHSSQSTKFLEVGKTYHFSGCPDGGSNSTYRITFTTYKVIDGTVTALQTVGIANSLGSSLTITEEYDGLLIYIDVFQGHNAQNLKFEPMIVLGTTKPERFKPYSQGKVTRAELDEKLQDVGTGDGTVRYVNDTSDENYDYIQLKKSDGTWVNFERAYVERKYLIKDGVDNANFAYTGPDSVTSEIIPGDTLIFKATTSVAGSTTDITWDSDLVNLSNYSKIALDHFTSLFGGTSDAYAKLSIIDSNDSVVQSNQYFNHSGSNATYTEETLRSVISEKISNLDGSYRIRLELGIYGQNESSYIDVSALYLQ